MHEEVLQKNDVPYVKQENELLILLLNTVRVAPNALVWISVLRRPVGQPVLAAGRSERLHRQALLSPVRTTNGLDLEPKGDYEQYVYNNHKYCHEVVHVGGIVGQGSGACPGGARGWTWKTCQSGTAQERQNDVHVQR